MSSWGYIPLTDKGKKQEDALNRNFSYSLINYIQDNNITSIAPIAQATGLGRTTIENYRKGIAPTLGKAILIANAIGIDINDMVKKNTVVKPVELIRPVSLSSVSTEDLVRELQHRLDKTKSML